MNKMNKAEEDYIDDAFDDDEYEEEAQKKRAADITAANVGNGKI